MPRKGKSAKESFVRLKGRSSSDFMQRLHHLIPKTRREKSLVLLFSVASSVVTSALMTQEWFMGYTKASKSSQADSPPLVLVEPSVLGDPIVLKDPNKKSPATAEKSPEVVLGVTPGTMAPGTVTGGSSPSEYGVIRGFSAPQSASLIKINRYECSSVELCYRPHIEEECRKQDQTLEFNRKIAEGWTITSSHSDSVGASAYGNSSMIAAQCIGTRYILTKN